MAEKAQSVHRSKVTDDEIVAAAASAKNLSQLLRSVGLAAYGGNYETMRRRLMLLGLTDPRFHTRAKREPSRQFTYAELQSAARRADSFAQMLRVLDVNVTAAAHRRVKAATIRWGIDTSHFLGQAHNRGQKFPGRAAPLAQVLVAGKLTNTIDLKRRLLEAGLLVRECAECERDEWNGEPIPLELDHINGDRTDNRLENVRLVCPNCHAQTPTYRGRNIGRRAGEPPAEALPLPDFAADAARRLQAILPPGCVA
jgi:hypothetical protein